MLWAWALYGYQVVPILLEFSRCSTFESTFKRGKREDQSLHVSHSPNLRSIFFELIRLMQDGVRATHRRFVLLIAARYMLNRVPCKGRFYVPVNIDVPVGIEEGAGARTWPEWCFRRRTAPATCPSGPWPWPWPRLVHHAAVP